MDICLSFAGPLIAAVCAFTAQDTTHWPDLIARIDGLNTVIAGPLSHSRKLCYTINDKKCLEVDEYDAIIIGEWNRQGITWWHWPDIIQFPGPHQEMAIHHLFKGEPLRAGDFTALHGILLSSQTPAGDLIAHEWQGFMKCVGVVDGETKKECDYHGF